MLRTSVLAASVITPPNNGQPAVHYIRLYHTNLLQRHLPRGYVSAQLCLGRRPH